VTDVYNL